MWASIKKIPQWHAVVCTRLVQGGMCPLTDHVHGTHINETVAAAILVLTVHRAQLTMWYSKLKMIGHSNTAGPTVRRPPRAPAFQGRHFQVRGRKIIASVKNLGATILHTRDRCYNL